MAQAFFLMLTTGTGSGTVTPTSGLLDIGVLTTLTANPAANSTFAGWSGNADCSDGSITMVPAGMSCTATFNLNPVVPPPVAASVGSDIALFLTFLGVIAITGFQRWRKRIDS